ncbi:MAG TPA: response regulator transcription factor [Candidatus Copromorpha excrementigallinarum]|uniref:Stage 0 sporulation protein A homolog n=1 Tax=Candidatus Allocopromorpha excrementigallinarum TaxID=2840742 RepID=A0A9D1HZ60_9FIRM|nr:response regulator transcription factor [Candidatus Copromorpha excrementigallinarum]
MAKDKVMIVDNEMEILQLIKLYLSREGYDIVWTTDSTRAAALAMDEKPDLILLDVVMPGLSGIELCGKIREHSDVPILFVSCKGQDMDKVLGLSIGGDDYITKPFSPAELVARVKAHLRRRNIINSAHSAGGSDHDSLLSIGGLEVNLTAHTVTVNGEPVHLTAKEFELLVLFCKYPNRVFTSRQIFNNIWDTYGLEEDVRTVMVHISNLRKKIEPNPEKPQYIATVRGVGYKLVSD